MGGNLVLRACGVAFAQEHEFLTVFSFSSFRWLSLRVGLALLCRWRPSVPVEMVESTGGMSSSTLRSPRLPPPGPANSTPPSWWEALPSGDGWLLHDDWPPGLDWYIWGRRMEEHKPIQMQGCHLQTDLYGIKKKEEWTVLELSVLEDFLTKVSMSQKKQTKLWNWIQEWNPCNYHCKSSDEQQQIQECVAIDLALKMLLTDPLSHYPVKKVTAYSLCLCTLIHIYILMLTYLCIHIRLWPPPLAVIEKAKVNGLSYLTNLFVHYAYGPGQTSQRGSPPNINKVHSLSTSVSSHCTTQVTQMYSVPMWTTKPFLITAWSLALFVPHT